MFIKTRAKDLADCLRRIIYYES